MYLQNSLLLMFKWSIMTFIREASLADSLSASTSSEVLEPREPRVSLSLTTADSFHLAALFLDVVDVDKVDIVEFFLDDLQC